MIFLEKHDFHKKKNFDFMILSKKKLEHFDVFYYFFSSFDFNFDFLKSLPKKSLIL
jgi:hypothetical protein